MKIINKIEPFCHTIIYDYFSEMEIKEMLIEKDNIIDSHNASMLIDKTDKHHLDLKCSIDSFEFYFLKPIQLRYSPQIFLLF